MNTKPAEFLDKKFREYYKKHLIDSVPDIGAREFGYGIHGKKIVSRHKAFHGVEEFNAFLSREAPLYVSYSVAYYEQPSKTPMKAKGFQGADLVYEFDADDIPSACKKDHDSWACPKCLEKGKGHVTNCPSCGSPTRLEEWVCPECLDKTKEQTLKLVGLLENDIGFSRKDFSLNFSGSKGFHLHLRSNPVRELSHRARIQLLDYLTAKGVDLEKMFYSRDKTVKGPNTESLGWGKRVYNGIRALANTDLERLATFGGVTKRKIKGFEEDKASLVEKIDNGVYFFPGTTTEALGFWRSTAKHVLEEKALRIDRQTSIDISKIVRVPGTLHGGTGLQAKQLNINDLEGFDSLSDSIVFSDKPVTILLNSVPRFFLNRREYGPFKDKAIVPEHVAVYLLARGAASEVVV